MTTPETERNHAYERRMEEQRTIQAEPKLPAPASASPDKVREAAREFLAATADWLPDAARLRFTLDDSLQSKLTAADLRDFASLPASPDKVREALEACRDRFAEYVETHVRKGDAIKADRNRAMLHICLDALASPPADAGDAGGEAVATRCKFCDENYPKVAGENIRLRKSLERIEDGSIDSWAKEIANTALATPSPRPEAETVLRCLKTTNPCGTDTWQVGYPCQCVNCQKYLREAETASEARK